MTVQITGRQMEVGDALNERIVSGLESVVTKYFDRQFDASVTVAKRGHEFLVDCTVHLPSGIILQSSGSTNDPYTSLEMSLEKMQKRVRRYHGKLKDRHKRAPLPSEVANAFILQGAGDQDPDEDSGDAPVIIAQSAENVKTMSVSEAVMQLELSEMPAVLFRNVKHGGLNMVYRRQDGHINWVDPDGHSATD